jgi:PAS domain S-box-containing protein
VILFAFVAVFLVLSISSLLSERKLEATIIKELETMHKAKLAFADEVLKNETPITLNKSTVTNINNLLMKKDSCEPTTASSSNTCTQIARNIQQAYLSQTDYKDVAIFTATGTRVFYASASPSLKLTPGELNQRPRTNSKFSPSGSIANTFIGKAGTTPNGMMLVAFELIENENYLGTVTFVITQKSLSIYGRGAGNYTTYAIDSAGSVRNLSNNLTINPSTQVIDACRTKETKTLTTTGDGVRIFSTLSYIPQIDMCVVTETNNIYSSELGSSTYLTNYILGLGLLLVLWLITGLFGRGLSKKLAKIKEKGEAMLLGKEPVETKQFGIIEIDDLNRTFDFILHKLKTGRSAEESAELLQKNILQKAKSTTTDALASRDKFKEAVESAQDIIILLTPSGLVTYANKALEKTTGFRLEHVEGKYPYETWHKTDIKDELNEAIKGVLANKSSVVLNAEGKRGDGGIYESEIRLSPIENNHTGSIDSILMIERDISDERQRDRVKNEFISVVSHELRTPMTVIRGYSALLAEGKLGELNQKQKEYIDRINSETSRLLDLANDMLDLQKFDAGKADLHLEKQDVRELLKDIVNEFEPLFAKKDLTITFEDHTEHSDAQIDKRYLNRAVTNLVQNALKFTEKGGVSVYTVNPDKDYIVVAIKDTGSGIPQEALPHLFTKFYQASNVLNRKQEGSGLGLSIVKKIVEAHKGIVWVESLEGKGTTFYIALPVA